MPEPLITLYAVKNSKGQYYLPRGQNSHLSRWVDDPKKARIYARPGPAKSAITFFASAYPEFDTPFLVEFHVTHEVVVDQKERVAKSIQKKESEKKRQEARHTKYKIEQLQRELKRNMDELDKLGKK